MFEIPIDVDSSLYRIYRESFSKWECPPGSATLTSFIYVLLLHFFAKYTKRILTVASILIASASYFFLLRTLIIEAPWNQTLFWSLDAFVIYMIRMFIFSTMASLLIVKIGKVLCKFLAGRVCAAIRWLRKNMSIPVVIFIGHSNYRRSRDVERFSDEDL